MMSEAWLLLSTMSCLCASKSEELKGRRFDDVQQEWQKWLDDCPRPVGKLVCLTARIHRELCRLGPRFTLAVYFVRLKPPLAVDITAQTCLSIFLRQSPEVGWLVPKQVCQANRKREGTRPPLHRDLASPDAP
ncbi:unnamed protein product [Polarella glacialis]|uniref:Secreted protein n=1 Tax=Polarella glacialis TaxID=89957 RepID=A0A813GLZ9_POLGL|nr:unnamed protein product [Polarella glacialis]CAE8633035.1 unnamed protein product [Polarella glacialis]